MTEEEEADVKAVMALLARVLYDMGSSWDKLESISQSDFIRWRDMIIHAYDILLEVM